VENALLAIQILTNLLSLASQASQMIQAAQAAGTDITSEQLTTLANQYTAAATQLSADIAAKGGTPPPGTG